MSFVAMHGITSNLDAIRVSVDEVTRLHLVRNSE